MKADSDIGVGILGTGFGITTHYPAWSSLTGVRVMGVAGRNTERASNISRQYGLPITDGTLDALLSSAEVDVIVVAVPPTAQPSSVEAALKSGKNVFAEKPLATSVHESSRLLELAERRGLQHGVNFCLRRAPASMAMKQAISDGRVGQPWRAVVTWHRGYRADTELGWNWKCDAQSGGGVMTALGAHVLDLLMWLFSGISVGCALRQVNIRRRLGENGKARAVTAEDAVSIMLGFQADVTAFVSLDSTAIGGNGLSIDIYGDRGSLHVRQASVRDVFAGLNVSVTDQHGNTKALLNPGDEDSEGRIGLVRRLAHEFVRAIREPAPFSPSFADGVKVAEAVSQLRWLA